MYGDRKMRSTSPRSTLEIWAVPLTKLVFPYKYTIDFGSSKAQRDRLTRPLFQIDLTSYATCNSLRFKVIISSCPFMTSKKVTRI
jgi:hypothetical protein